MEDLTEATPYSPQGEKPIINSIALENAADRHDGGYLGFGRQTFAPQSYNTTRAWSKCGAVISLEDAPDWVNVGGRKGDRVISTAPLEGEPGFDPRFYDLINGEYVQKAIRRTTAIQLAQDVLDVTQADLANDLSGYVKRIAQAQGGFIV